MSVVATLRVPLLVLLVLCLGACSEEELVSKLTERQSIAVMASLLEDGISAKRKADTRGSTFSIVVSRSDYPGAIRVLDGRWPKREYEGAIDALVTTQGVFDDWRQTNNRRDEYLLGVKIERLISSLPGVSEVKAEVRLPPRKTSATSFGYHKSGNSTQFRVGVSVLVVTDRRKLNADEKAEFEQTIRRVITGVLPTQQDASIDAEIIVEDQGLARPVDKSPSDRMLTMVWPFSFRMLDNDRTVAMTELSVALLFIAVPGFVMGFFAGFSSCAVRYRRRQSRGGRKNEK